MKMGLRGHFKIPYSKIAFGFWPLVFGLLFFSGCQTSTGNVGQVQSYVLAQAEADWIRNGEPIKFENELWYPQDGVESLLDLEVSSVGVYQGVQFFVDKTDVRPYNRLYTKFGRNLFRYYEKEKQK